MPRAKITSSKPDATIIQALKQLRELVDGTKDPILRAMAYEWETAINWATTRTVGWDDPETQAIRAAGNLRDELYPGQRVEYPSADPADVARVLKAMGVQGVQPPAQDGKRGQKK